MDLKCPKCDHKWSAGVDLNQRLIFCPGCSSLVPLDDADLARPSKSKSAQMTGVLPFSLGEPKPQSEGPQPSKLHRETTQNHAVLLMELAGTSELRKDLPEDQFKQALAVAKRVFRYGIQQFGGREIDKSKGLVVLFPRPVDAARFALNLILMLEKTSREIGVPLRARVAIDNGEVKVVESSHEEVAGGAKPVEATGVGMMSIRPLVALCHPGQILMSRAAWDLARQDAGDRMPPGTRWMNHAVFLLDNGRKVFELCEVGVVGTSPLCPPGKPPVPARADNSDVSFLGGIQLGAEALSHSFRGRGSQSRSGILRPSDLPSFSPDKLVGHTIAHYRIDSLRDEDRKSYYYLARDTQQDRDVQLKVLKKSLASNHEELIRFIREGITATYIGHPNIFNAYETGSEDDLYYIVYEVFDGTSLLELVDNLGPMEPRMAAGYVLQAARGVAAAHDAGIVHRDLNPANLLLTTEGRIEVCGLNLAKIQENRQAIEKEHRDEEPIFKQAMGSVTEAGVALGTPAYIAPEQARDAASVDFRADQYSLGCVLYFVLTGKPPFPGNTAMEVMANRKNSRLEPPHTVNPSIPVEISRLAERLLAEDPAKRFNSMREAVSEMEAALGIRKEGGESVSLDGMPAGFPEDVYRQIKSDQRTYYGTSLAKARGISTFLLFLVCFAGTATSVYTNWFQFAGAFVGLFVLTLLFSVILGGILHRTILFRRLRRGLAILPKTGWAVGIILLAGFTYFLYVTGLLPFWGGISVLSVALAFVYQLGIVLPLRFKRAAALSSTRELVKSLRSSGYSEENLMEVVFTAGGRDWEEFFEEVFGYEEKMAARHHMAAAKLLAGRVKFAAWRDPIFEWIAGMDADRKLSLNQTQLAKAELKRLRKEGMAEEAARRKAREEAQRMIREEHESFALSRQPALGGGGLYGAGFPGTAAGYPTGPRGTHYGTHRGVAHMAFSGAGNFLGAAVTLAYLAPMIAPQAGIPIPPAILEFLQTEYYKWGYGGTFYALVIGSVLTKNAFSRRYFTSSLGMVGALMLVGAVPIVAFVNQSSFDHQTCVFFGVGLMVISMGTGFLRRFTSPRGFLPF